MWVRRIVDNKSCGNAFDMKSVANRSLRSKVASPIFRDFLNAPEMYKKRAKCEAQKKRVRNGVKLHFTDQRGKKKLDEVIQLVPMKRKVSLGGGEGPSKRNRKDKEIQEQDQEKSNEKIVEDILDKYRAEQLELCKKKKEVEMRMGELAARIGELEKLV